MNKTIRFFSFFLAVLLLISAVPMTAFAKNEIISGVAFVDASSLRLRSSASTSSKTLATASRNEVVVVLGKQGAWYKVLYNLTEGYMHSDYLDVRSAENVELGYGKVNANTVNLRSGASTSSKSIGTASKGDKAYIIGVNAGWYKVICGQNICYIRSDYLDLTEAPYENKASSNTPKFFRGGISTGTAPSASALNGTVVTEPTDSEPEATTPSTGTSVAASGVKQGIAYTTGSGLRLRASASTASKTITSANKGEVVVVTGKEGDWYKVIYNLKEGYMHSNYLNVKSVADVELGYGTINASSVNLRSGAGTGNSVIATGSRGDKAYIIGINNGWYKVIYGQNICYIRSDYLDLTEAPYENKSSSKSPLFFRGGVSTGVTPSASALNGTTGSTSSSGTSSGSTSAIGAKIVETAKKYLGVPYVWGGASPSGFDCSGFVYYVTRSVGLNTSRTLTAMYSQGTPVEKSDLLPGDIVFFKNTYKSGISHVGIYVGNGQFIHSPHTGQVVSFADLNSDYYVSHYYGACRMG